MTAFASIVLAALPGLGAKSGAEGALTAGSSDGQGIAGQGAVGAFGALMATLTGAAPAQPDARGASPTPPSAATTLSSPTPLSAPKALPTAAAIGPDVPVMGARSPDAALSGLLPGETVEPSPSGRAVEPLPVEAVIETAERPHTADALAAAGTVLVAPTPTAARAVATPESEPKVAQAAAAASPRAVADTMSRLPDAVARPADPVVPTAAKTSDSPPVDELAPTDPAASPDLPTPVVVGAADLRLTPVDTPTAAVTPIITAPGAPAAEARLDASAAVRATPKAVADVRAAPDAVAPDPVAADVRVTPPPGTATPQPAIDAVTSLAGQVHEDAAKPETQAAVRPAVARAAPPVETPAVAVVDTPAGLALHTALSPEAPVPVDSATPEAAAPVAAAQVKPAPETAVPWSATDAVTSLIGRVLDGAGKPEAVIRQAVAVAEAAPPVEAPVDAVVDTPVELALDTALSPEAPVPVEVAVVETPAVPAPVSSRRASRVEVARPDGVVEAVDPAAPELKPAVRADTPAVNAAPAPPARPDLPAAQAATVDPGVEAEQATLDTTAAAPTPQAAAEVPAEAAPTRGSPETVARLAADIAQKLEGKTTRFDIQLDPLGLGKVDVSIEINADGRLSASLSFDSAQTAADLRGRAGELRQALEKAGFDLADGGLSFDMNNPGGSSGREARETLAAWSSRAFETARTGLEQADALAARSPWSRTPSGGVDIRI